jgi:hypothetical protein
MRADEQKPHRRLSPWASQHNMTKPNRCKGQGKYGGCASKVHVLIRGDLSEERSKLVMGAGLRPRSKGLEAPPDPTAASTARPGVISGVFRQKSAEAILGDGSRTGSSLKGRTP